MKLEMKWSFAEFLAFAFISGLYALLTVFTLGLTGHKLINYTKSEIIRYSNVDEFADVSFKMSWGTYMTSIYLPAFLVGLFTGINEYLKTGAAVEVTDPSVFSTKVLVSLFLVWAAMLWAQFLEINAMARSITINK